MCICKAKICSMLAMRLVVPLALLLAHFTSSWASLPLPLHERGSDDYRRYLWKRDEMSIGNVNTLWAAAPEFETVKWILLADSPQQISEALTWAQARGAAVTVRSGGHSYGGFSCQAPAGSLESLLIDVRALRNISVDPARGTVTVGPEYTAATAGVSTSVTAGATGAGWGAAAWSG